MSADPETAVATAGFARPVAVDRPSPGPRPERVRLDFIDGIRALAALFVVVCHSYFEPANGYYASRLMNHLGLSYGHVAVDVFIVVSGFCLMLPIARRGGSLGPLSTFMKRRARRILPPYYACLALSVLFIATVGGARTGTVWDNSLPLTWETLIKHLFLVHNVPPPGRGGTINFPLWSIAVEFQIYMFMPLIVWTLNRWGRLFTLAWTMALGLGARLLFPSLDMMTTWYLGLFAMGVIAAKEAVAGRVAPWLRPLSYALGALVSGLLILKGNAFFKTYTHYYDIAFGLVTALVLMVTMADAGSMRSMLTRALSWPPLVTVGVFSYSLYLVHAPLLHVGWMILKPLFDPRPEVMFLLLLGWIPAIIAVAYAFHRAFERPFMTTPSAHTAKPPVPA